MTHYAYTLFHNVLLELAGQLVDQAEPIDLNSPKLNTSAAGAIVLSAASVEAAASFAVEMCFVPPELVRKHPHPKPEIHRLLRKHFDGMRRGGPKKRIKEAARLRGIQIDWNTEPWVSLSDLHDLRNSLIHYKSAPVLVRGEVQFPENLQNLAGRLGLWTVVKAGGTWLDTFLNREGAEWAFAIAQETVGELNASDWYGPVC
jgi:hypothetical protein